MKRRRSNEPVDEEAEAAWQRVLASLGSDSMHGVRQWFVWCECYRHGKPLGGPHEPDRKELRRGYRTT